MNTQDANGTNFIPASQRPDGTWRKPRRVKEGYVPQEEVPLYESKGKQYLNRKPLSVASSDSSKPGQTAHSTIPGLFIQDEKNKKKKVKPAVVDEIKKSIAQMKITEPPVPQQDPAKRLKNLKKRLREIEALEQKIKLGEIKNPEKDQLEKVSRKSEIVNEIKIVENSL